MGFFYEPDAVLRGESKLVAITAKEARAIEVAAEILCADEEDTSSLRHGALLQNLLRKHREQVRQAYGGGE